MWEGSAVLSAIVKSPKVSKEILGVACSHCRSLFPKFCRVTSSLLGKGSSECLSGLPPHPLPLSKQRENDVGAYKVTLFAFLKGIRPNVRCRFIEFENGIYIALCGGNR